MLTDEIGACAEIYPIPICCTSAQQQDSGKEPTRITIPDFEAGPTSKPRPPPTDLPAADPEEPRAPKKRPPDGRGAGKSRSIRDEGTVTVSLNLF